MRYCILLSFDGLDFYFSKIKKLLDDQDFPCGCIIDLDLTLYASLDVDF